MKEEVRTNMARIAEEIKGDEDLMFYHRSITDDPDVKPAEIAEKNKLPVNEIKNIRKRYMRIAQKIWLAS